MLHSEVFFPSDRFSDPETLETLVSLGLRRTLGFAGLLDCARSVSLLHDAGDSEAPSYGKKLLVCLDALALKLSTDGAAGNWDESEDPMVRNNKSLVDGNPMCVDSSEGDMNYCIENLDANFLLGTTIDDKPEEEFWSEMKAIAWCPVSVDPPLKGLPWLKSCNQVAAPSIVRPKTQMWMVSCSMHILDGECCSMDLQHKLGWMDCPTIDILSTQLIELSKFYGQLKLQSLVEPDFDAALQKGIPLLYSKLQDYIGTEDLMVLKSALTGVSWVWIGDDFVSPNALAFDSPVKFSPYLFVVPSELSEFRVLLLELGVRLSFDVWDYFNVLQRLQNDVKGFPLSSDQLSFVHCVLEAVVDCCSDKPLLEVSETPFLIPDSFGVLRHARDLVYNDAPWMENHTLAGKHFAHPSISNDLANRLGIQSLRCLSLVDEEMTKDLSCMDYARINELLALYGNNDFLLFDLLELADCCKAKKLHLIFDKREHPRQSLLQHNLGTNTITGVCYYLACANVIGVVPHYEWSYLEVLSFKIQL
jgi:sacsin